MCALRFFYGVTLCHDAIPERIAYARELPVVLSADDVVHFLEAIPSLKGRTALTTVYAAGLRVPEVVPLNPDIDSRCGADSAPPTAHPDFKSAVPTAAGSPS